MNLPFQLQLAIAGCSKDLYHLHFFDGQTCCEDRLFTRQQLLLDWDERWQAWGALIRAKIENQAKLDSPCP